MFHLPCTLENELQHQADKTLIQSFNSFTMPLRNHNSWTDEMTDRAMNLIRNMKVPITTNRHGEKVIKMTKKNTQVMKTIAIVLNKDFGSTLTERSVANKFHYHNRTEEQKAKAKKRYLENRHKRARLVIPKPPVPIEKQPVIGVSDAPGW